MKNFKRILSSVLSAALCLGMIVPAMVACVSAASDPLAGIDSKNYTKIDFSSDTEWAWAKVNNIEPSHTYTNYKNQACVKLNYNDVASQGTHWKWIDNSGKDIEYMLAYGVRNKDALNTEHKYVVVTYAATSYDASNLKLMYWGEAQAVLTDDMSESQGYWIASEPTLVTEKYYDRAKSGYMAIYSDEPGKTTELYIKEMVFFANEEDAKKYSEAVPAAYNDDLSEKPVITFVEVPVASQDFESVNDLVEISVTSSLAENVSICDDINKTNLRDPQTREVGGIPSLEKDEAGNTYLRVSRRISNTYGVDIPIASSHTLAAAGEGRYVLTFDFMPITTETLLFNVPGEIKDSAFYEAPFAGDQVAFRIRTAGAATETIVGTAPGTLIGYDVPTNGFTAGCHETPVMDQWYSLYYEFEIANTTKALTLNIWGGNWPIRNVDYAVDNVKLVKLDKQGSVIVAPPEEVAIPEGPATNVAAEPYKVQGIMFNLDDSRFSEPNRANAAFMTKEDAITYVDQYIDCHITDLAFCVNTTFMSMYPSEVWEDQLDEYAKGKGGSSVVWQRYATLGIDPWQLWFERCWEKGVNPWISFRMNDHHGHLSNGNIVGHSILTADWYWDSYDEYKRVSHRAPNTYRGDLCPDWTHDIIREKWLAYIEEAVNKYDVYGIELDWLRDPIFTTVGNEMAAMEMMNQFHRDVKAIVDAAEAKWGHEIKIGARVARDIQTNTELGLDVMTWCADGVLDVVIPCAYYMTDTEIPVQTWKKILQAYDVELYPNASMGYISQREGDRSTSDIPYYTHAYMHMNETVEMMAGTAASYFAQGADKVYLYNLFGDSANPIKAEHKIDTNVVDAPVNNNYARWKMQSTLGSIEKINTMTRRYILTYQDQAGYFGTSHTQLPADVKRVEKYAYIHFYTGDVQADDKVTLRLGVSNATPDLTGAIKVFVNTKPATLLGKAAGTTVLEKDMTIYTFSVDASAIKNSAMVEMTTTNEAKPYSVTYAELVFQKADGTVIPSVTHGAAKFTDVSASSTYYDAIGYVVDNKLFTGMSETTFEPNTTMNRAMYVTVLGRLEGVNMASYTGVSFTDVDPIGGSWYAPYVEWAASNGVVNGMGDGTFSVTGPITVAQACVILARNAENASATNQTGMKVSDYSDSAEIPAWANDGIAWAVSNGIYVGQDGKLLPTSPASRAVVATMFYNYVRAFGK